MWSSRQGETGDDTSVSNVAKKELVPQEESQD